MSLLGGSALLPRELLGLPDEPSKVTSDMVRGCEGVSGLAFSEEERALMLSQLGDEAEAFAKARAVTLDNGKKPALATPQRPATDVDLAFATVREQASLLRARKVSSVELTKLYLERLRRFDPTLLCVITLT